MTYTIAECTLCSCREQILWICFLMKLCHFFIWFILIYLINLSFLCMYVHVHFHVFYHVYYHWIFGSPRPTVCKLVFFHSHLASGLQLWEFPLTSMHLHFFVWRHTKTCTCYLIPSQLGFGQSRVEDHLTWSLCPREASLARGPSVAWPTPNSTHEFKLPNQTDAPPSARPLLCSFVHHCTM